MTPGLKDPAFPGKASTDLGRAVEDAEIKT